MRIVINADDFGRSKEVNQAIIRAYHEGVLTSTSLMVAGEAVQDAVELAHQNPGLAVGLHIVVINGRSVLPHGEVPHLVDSRGFFSNSPIRTGIYYFANRAVQNELAQELEAQFERFGDTGLPLSHVDGHLHMHVHPTVFNQVITLADRYEAIGIRVPRDELGLALGYDHSHAVLKTLWAIIFSLLSRWCLGQLRNHHLIVADRVYGLMQSGRMQEPYVVELLRRLNVPTAEIYFHPATKSAGEPLGPNPGDLASLLSPTVRQIIRERGLCRSTYADLRDS